MKAPGPPDALQALAQGTLDCVHCGLCLSACPTYRVTGRETSSPRGRIYLMRGAAEGALPPESIAAEMQLCLGCRACETACPAGVPFGSLLETTRAALLQSGLRRGFGAWLERLALRKLLPHPRRLRRAVSLLLLAQWLGLLRSAHKLLALPLLPRPLRARLRFALELLASSEAGESRAEGARVLDASGQSRGRVAFFEGCIMPALFGPVNRATLRVLSRCGLQVVTPAGQTCCGALHAHAGDTDSARRLARANLAAFADAGVDAIVVNSAGCGATLRELSNWLPDAARFSAPVRDICEVIAGAGLPGELRAVPGTLCYDDPCHLLHGQGVSRAPRELLAKIPGLKLIPHADPGDCCGAAGTYNLAQPEMSRRVLARKLDALAAADPDWIASGNPGCLMQLAAGVRQRGLRARVVHPVVLLDMALERRGAKL